MKIVAKNETVTFTTVHKRAPCCTMVACIMHNRQQRWILPLICYNFISSILCPENHNQSALALALTSRSIPSTTIQVTTVKTPSDVQQLADLRYAEWIVDDNSVEDKSADGQRLRQPSLAAFRAATAELWQERTEQGAVAFLARLVEEGESEENSTGMYSLGRTNVRGVVVGACELSPIEFRNNDDHKIDDTNIPSSFLQTTTAAATQSKQQPELQISSMLENTSGARDDFDFLYVTDVVTDKNYRRRGVGRALMAAAEQEAAVAGANSVFRSREVIGDENSNNENANINNKQTTRRLFLHVHKDNVAAMQFYCHRPEPPSSSVSGLGYVPAAEDADVKRLQQEGLLDVDRLAENSGAVGQVLLTKTIDMVDDIDSSMKHPATFDNSKGRRRRTSGTTGFGVANAAKNTKNTGKLKKRKQRSR